MAILFPTYEKILNLKVPPTPGEKRILDFLIDSLDNTYEIYFQPFINGDQPDIIVVRKGSGVWIIEVKDWNLNSYRVIKEGAWGLSNGKKGYIKSPVEQALEYKNNLYDLHIEGLLEKKIKNPKYFSIINYSVYFHHEIEEDANVFINLESRKDRKYFDILGYDSLNEERLKLLLDERRLNQPSFYFNDDLYNIFIRFLKPSEHVLEIGEEVSYNSKQLSLIISKPIIQKVKGVAGSGKTLVLAKRAVNAHKRTGGRILILTFNKTLKNYIHDQISNVREQFKWGFFYIDNYHQFFKSMANNLNLIIGNLGDFNNERFFEEVKGKTQRFDAVFIDEIQDYKIEWQRILKKYFLTDNGELVVFGDEKQNIYGRELEDKKVKTLIRGAWNILDQSYRLSPKISNLSVAFFDQYLSDKYDKDEMIPVQAQIDFESSVNDEMHYYYCEDYSLKKVERLYSNIKKLQLHPNDICFLASNISILQKIDLYIRKHRREKTTTTFETKELHDQLTAEIDTPNQLRAKLNQIRKNKKVNFWMNYGTTKLSTIHSFKGWEIKNLVLIIDSNSSSEYEEEKEKIQIDELIYTGITRCRRNLFIFNIGNHKFHSFFTSQKQGLDYFQDSWS